MRDAKQLVADEIVVLHNDIQQMTEALEQILFKQEKAINTIGVTVDLMKTRITSSKHQQLQFSMAELQRSNVPLSKRNETSTEQPKEPKSVRHIDERDCFTPDYITQ
jgi:hypothetical protein